MKPRYSYDDARKYAASLGLNWPEHWASAIDKVFDRLDLTQSQADLLLREHIWRVRWLFSPQHYSIQNRIKLAIWFLFGRFR